MRIFFSLAAALLSACVPISSNTSDLIPNTNFALEIKKGAEIGVISPESSGYADGMRTYITSHNRDNWSELVRSENYKKYYDFQIYESEPWNGQHFEWVKQNCYSQYASIKRIFTGSVIVFHINSCFTVETFALVSKNQVYKVTSGPDTMNVEGIWELLKTAEPL